MRVCERIANAILETTGIPVVWGVAGVSRVRRVAGAMKKMTRFMLGALSSLLLAVGLARAADRLDPIRLNTESASDSTLSSTPDSGTWCDIVDKDN